MKYVSLMKESGLKPSSSELPSELLSFITISDMHNGSRQTFAYVNNHCVNLICFEGNVPKCFGILVSKSPVHWLQAMIISCHNEKNYMSVNLYTVLPYYLSTL